MRSATLPPVAAMPDGIGRIGDGGDRSRPRWRRARCPPGGTLGRAGVPAARRLIVAPLAVTYTSSRPSSGSAAGVGLWSSISSSLALAPPVTTSLTTRWSGALPADEPSAATPRPGPAAGARTISGPGARAGARRSDGRRRTRHTSSDGGGAQVVSIRPMRLPDAYRPVTGRAQYNRAPMSNTPSDDRAAPAPRRAVGRACSPAASSPSRGSPKWPRNRQAGRARGIPRRASSRPPRRCPTGPTRLRASIASGPLRPVRERALPPAAQPPGLGWSRASWRSSASSPRCSTPAACWGWSATLRPVRLAHRRRLVRLAAADAVRHGGIGAGLPLRRGLHPVQLRAARAPGRTPSARPPASRCGSRPRASSRPAWASWAAGTAATCGVARASCRPRPSAAAADRVRARSGTRTCCYCGVDAGTAGRHESLTRPVADGSSGQTRH